MKSAGRHDLEVPAVLGVILRLCSWLFGAFFACSIAAHAEPPPISDILGLSVHADIGGQQSDEPWSKWLLARCAPGDARWARSTCLRDYNALRVALENAEKQPVAAEWLLPFTPPNSWWGLDPIAAANLPRSGEHDFEFLISRDGQFIVHVFGSDRPVWLDAYSGQVLAHDDSPPGPVADLAEAAFF